MGVAREAQAPARARGAAAFPRAVAVTVGTVAALAAGATVAAGANDGWRARAEVEIVVPFAVLLVVAAAMILRFRTGKQSMALEPFEAVMVPAIFAMPALVAIGLVALAQTIANAYRRNHPVKATFNVAQWTLVAAVMSLVWRGLDAGTALTWSVAGAILAAVVVGALTNIVAICTVIHLAEGRPLDELFRALGPTLATGWSVNATFGLLFVSAYRANPASIALFLAPLGVLWWSHRCYAAAMKDTTRMGGLHAASQTLAAPVDPRDAIPAFLAQVRRSFEARAVDLVLVRDGGREVFRAQEEGAATRIETDDVQTLAAAILRRARTGPAETLRVTAAADGNVGVLAAREGWRECIAAPVIIDGTIAGALCVYDPSGPERGFEQGELAVLGALAGEAAAAIQKGELLAAIMEERSKLAEIIDQTSDGILTLAPDGLIVVWNSALEAITGFAASEMIGQRALGKLRPRDVDGADLRLERWATGVSFPPDVQILTADGEQRWLSCSTSVVSDDEQMPRALIIVARDVTRAREVERLKGDFVAMVSHELRTPLTPIKGWSHTLVASGDRMTPEERTAAARSILVQADHLERLIKNLLEVAQIEQGTGQVRDGIADVAGVISQVVKEHRQAHPARTIAVEVPPGLRARGDELFIGQVVSNLISNAVKYAPATEPIIVRASSRAGGVEVAVIDRGPGIPAGEIERIFERFHRLGNALSRPQGGAGLGLYIARQLAQAMNGSLSVESRLGSGSTFSLRLRRVEDLAAVG